VVIGGTKIIWSLLNHVKQIIGHALHLHQVLYQDQLGNLDHLEDRALLDLRVLLVHKGLKEILVYKVPLDQLALSEV
jgi:hypothetical protein